MSSSVQQGFPNISSPLVSGDGIIQQTWYQLLISLWRRTGSGSGALPFSSGDIKESAVAGPQLGWLECDGSAVSRLDFSGLFAAIGTTYGTGDNSTTFNIPDYRGRFRIGTDASFPLGISGGAETQTLITANLASHSHVVTDPHHTHGITDPGHVHTTAVVDNLLGVTGTDPGSAVAGNTGSATTGVTVNSAATGISIQNTGSGTPFSIMPPYAPVTVLIKT